MSDDGGKSEKRTRGLLGDLETIRSLLEEETGGSRPGSRSHKDELGGRSHKDEPGGRSNDEPPEQDADEDVPLLEDVVHGGVGLHETFVAGEGDFEDSFEDSGEAGLDEEIFKALLSDEWRESAREILDEARAVIEKHQTEWTPAHTDELNQALKVRIDATVQQWLREVVQARLDELRQLLLTTVSAQMHQIIRERFESTPRHNDEGPDGE